MKNQTALQTNNELMAVETKKEWIKPELAEMNINSGVGLGADLGERQGNPGS